MRIRRAGSAGITAPRSAITSHGIGISSSDGTIFVGDEGPKFVTLLDCKANLTELLAVFVVVLFAVVIGSYFGFDLDHRF